MEGWEEAMEPASEQQAQGQAVRELIQTLVSILMDSFQSFQQCHSYCSLNVVFLPLNLASTDFVSPEKGLSICAGPQQRGVVKAMNGSLESFAKFNSLRLFRDSLWLEW